MLTTDLLKAWVVKGVVQPAYVDPGDETVRALAEELIAVFQMCKDRPRSELDDALRGAVGTGKRALLGRGLAKLLEDRCTFEVAAEADPTDIRRRLFEHAAAHHPVAPKGGPGRAARQEVIEAVAAELGMTPEQVDRSMYADLPGARLVRFDTLPAPAWLVDRYNVALAQAVLLRASQVRIRLRDSSPGTVRRFFQYLKFFRLLFRTRPLPEGGHEIDVDGPLSLFRLSTKYGLQLAELVPALLLCRDWTLDATVLWGRARQPRRFFLDATQGLRSHYPARGTYELREITWLRQRLEQQESRWRLETTAAILDLGEQQVCIPDAVLRHEDGRVAFLEVLGFWRKASLAQRLRAARAGKIPNVILAISRRLRASAEPLEPVDGPVTFFRDVIHAGEVVALAERVGLPASRGGVG